MEIPSSGSTVGPASGHGSPDNPKPTSYTGWLERYQSDWNGDGIANEADYELWWQSFGGSYGFTQEAWDAINPVASEPVADPVEPLIEADPVIDTVIDPADFGL